jgi:hypothetical protein
VLPPKKHSHRGGKIYFNYLDDFELASWWVRITIKI